MAQATQTEGYHFFRSPQGTQNFSQIEMKEFVESGMYKSGTKSDARKAQEAAVDTIRDILRGASGKVPPFNLLRIWDLGAS